MFVEGGQGGGHAGRVEVVLEGGWQRVVARVLGAVGGDLHEVASVRRAHRQRGACRTHVDRRVDWCMDGWMDGYMGRWMDG